MKKSLILAGMLVISYANAQEGKVGINTSEPKSTLDIQPSATNLSGTTNEGIIAPRLSKARIANITTPVEGTLVYAMDNVYSGSDTKVSKITEKGYYFYNGTEWVKAGAGEFVSSNIYTTDGSTNGDRTVSTADGFLTIKGNAWNPLVVNSEIVPGDPANNSRGGLAVHPNDMEKRVEFATTKDGDSRIWLDGDKVFIKRATGDVGIGNVDPKAKLDVSGEIIARGQNQTDAYFGGDNVPAVPGRPMNDVEIGSMKAGITDISLYNRTDGKSMNLFANELNAGGNIKSTTLSGDGDKIVMANNDGTLVKGVSISNFATSNIYTANGVLTSDRVVDQAGKWLDFNNGGVRITGNDGVYFPLTVNTISNGGHGGILIQPNGEHAKRIELNTTPEGNFRLWLDKDIMFVKRETGNVGIGTEAPKAKFDVQGGIRASQGYPQGDDTNLGYAFGPDGDTGLFAIGDPTNNNLGIGLDLYVNNVSRLNINQQGDVKVTNLAGDGDKIVVANNDGTLTKGVSISNFATSNLYTANGVLTSDRVVDQAGKWLTFHNGGVSITGNDGVYFPLTIRTMHSGGNGGIQIEPNGVHEKRIELNSTPEGDFRLWLDGDKIYVNRSTGNVGLSVGTNPAARLDVSGELIARGQTGEIEAYFGGDGVGGDVEVGSIKAGVTDVTLYNRGDSKAMRLVSGDVDARGEIKATSLSGDGDKIVIANNDGTLVKGVSVNNFVTTNIYTADGSTNGDRTVSTANGFLTIKGNSWNPLVVNSEIVPGDPANNSRGGLAVHPNDMEKRVEFATTKDGDSRIWLDGDKVFIKRATGNVGIGTGDPSEKLDVAGSIKSRDLAGTGNRNVMADANGKLVIGETAGTGVSMPADILTVDVAVGQMLFDNIDCTQPRLGWIFALNTGQMVVCTRNDNGKSVWMIWGHKGNVKGHTTLGDTGIKYLIPVNDDAEWLILAPTERVRPVGTTTDKFNTHWAIRVK